MFEMRLPRHEVGRRIPEKGQFERFDQDGGRDENEINRIIRTVSIIITHNQNTAPPPKKKEDMFNIL